MMPECPRAAIGTVLDAPVPGHFAIRLGSHKPWTPALIYLPCPFMEPEVYSEYSFPEDWCYSTGRSPNPLRARIGETDIEDNEMIIKLWQGARAIPVWQYAFLVARRTWARLYDQESYHARPVQLSILKHRDLLG